MAEMQIKRRSMNCAAPNGRRGPKPLLCGLLVLATAAPVAAAPATAAPSMHGRQRWALGIPLLRYLSEEQEGVGAGSEVDTSLLLLGLPASPAQVDLSFGHGLTDAILLGAQGQLAYTSKDDEQAGQDAETSSFLLSLGPRLDIFFGQLSVEEAGSEREVDVSQLAFTLRVALSLWP